MEKDLQTTFANNFDRKQFHFFVAYTKIRSQLKD